MKGYMYILRCANGRFYTGSTKYLDKRILQHQEGKGANYTKMRLPFQLIYYEEYDRIDVAYKRELQIKGWSRAKEIALIEGNIDLLPALSKARTGNSFPPLSELVAAV